MSHFLIMTSCVLCILLITTTLTNVDASNYWIGKSGKWSDPSHWSSGQVPGVASHVIVNMSSSEWILMDASAEIADLELLGGMIELQYNTTLNISSTMVFEAGIISCQNDGTLPTEVNSHVHVFGSTWIRGSERKYLRHIYLQQHSNQFTWTEGDMILYNASLVIHESANMSVQLSSSNALVLQADESRVQFDEYPNKVLNVDANLIYLYPPNGGVLDMMLHRGSRISTTRTNREMFPIIVSQDLPSMEYYADSVTNVGFGYRHSMYNVSYRDVDEDECAFLCGSSFGAWCGSFDYSFHNSTCRLSRFKAAQVGGLTSYVDYDYDSSSSMLWYPVRHFQRRSTERSVDSYLVANGPVEIKCRNESECTSFSSSVHGIISSLLAIESGANVSFESSVQLNSMSRLSVMHDATLSFRGANSKLIQATNSSITVDNRNSNSVEMSVFLNFRNGQHVISGMIDDGFQVHMSEGAIVTVANSANYPHGLNSIYASSWTISSAAKLYFADDYNMGGKLNISQQLIVEDGAISGSNVTIECTWLWLYNQGEISASELGYNIAEGPGAGRNASLGASGGAYGGRGAAGKVDAAAFTYGSVVHPRSYGSGGGAGYYGSSLGGGQGGGNIVVRASTVMVEGKISSNGGVGAFGGGGGGAGGSVSIYAGYMSGNGSISSNGGNGDFAGGLLSGGGGSGGRIAIHANSFAYNGTMSCYGGFTQPTYDLPYQEQAGAGTIYLATPNIHAVLVADQLVSGYSTYLLHQYSMSSDIVTSRKTSQELREGSLLDYQMDWSADNDWHCDVDLHVVGASPLTVSTSKFCLHRIYGSGEAKVHLRNGVNVTFFQNSLYLENVNVTIYDATFPADSNFTVGYNASLGFQNVDQTMATVNTNQGLYHIRRLEVLSGGSVVFRNASMVQVDELILHANSSVELHGDVSLVSSLVTIYGVFLSSPSKKVYALRIANSSSATWISSGAQTQSIELNYATLAIDGNFTISTTDATDAKVEYTTSGSTTAFGWLEIGSGGSLNVISGSTAFVDVYHISRTASATNVYGSMSLRGGGYSESNATVHVGANASLFVETDEFAFGEDVSIAGTGQWFVANYGVLKLPPKLPQSSASINVLSTGRLRATSPCTIASRIALETDGTLEIESNVTAVLSDLDMNGGDLYLKDALSEVEIVDDGSVWSSGLIYGEGQVVVTVGSLLTMTAGVYTSGSSLRIQETEIIVRGTAVISEIEIYWARNAKVINHGHLNFSDVVQWNYNRSILAFQELGYRLYDVPLEGTVLLHNRSKEECAKVCLFQQVTLYTAVAMQQHEAATSECVSFVYNEGLQACKFFIDRFTDKESSFDNATWLSWQVYNKEDTWTVPPSITNAVDGLVTVMQSSNTSLIGFPIYNFGSIRIDGTFSKLYCDGGFQQLQSTSESWIDGELEILADNTFSEEANKNILSGAVKGSGTIRFAGNSSSIGCANWTSVHVWDTMLTIDIQSPVCVYSGVDLMQVSTFRVQSGGSFILQSSPLVLEASRMLHVLDGGLMTSADDSVVSSDSFCSSSNGYSCFDYNITTVNVLVESGGGISMALGYIKASNITVRSTGSIVADGRGYGASADVVGPSGWDTNGLTGQFSKLGCSGGGHVGKGGYGFGNEIDYDVFGSVKPHGSIMGGYSWGFAGGQWSTVTNSSSHTRGGGAVILIANSMTVDGTISSRGHTVYGEDLSGGGAGGSVRIETTTLSGSGSLVADGGDGGSLSFSSAGSGGGGGGGRIVVFVEAIDTFQGFMSAQGGNGNQWGSPGTIYVGSLTSGKHGTLKCGSSVASMTSSPNPSSSMFAVVAEPISFGVVDEIVLDTHCRLLFQLDGQEAVIGHISGDGTGTLLITNQSVITPYSFYNGIGGGIRNNSLYVSQATVIVGEATMQAATIHIDVGGILSLTQYGGSTQVNASIYHTTNVTVAGELRFDYMTMRSTHSFDFRPIQLYALDTVHISAEGKVSSDAQGREGVYDLASCSYGSSSGCGEYGAVGGGGGGHGGYGGSGFEGRGGQPHGTAMVPVSFGSGGGGRWPNIAGGVGGGVISINTTNLVSYGVISADGSEGSGSGTGGGSGGSIYIVAEKLSGSGWIHANGGNGLYSNVHFGGAGAGGRVYIECSDCNGVSAYDSSLMSTIWMNITASAGAYTHHMEVSESTFQVPLLEDLGRSLKEWLATMPSEGGAGTVVIQQSGANAMKVENVNSVRHDTTNSTTINICQQRVNGGVYSLNCTRFPFELSYGVTPLLDANMMIDHIQISRYSWLRVVEETSISVSSVAMDSTSTIEVFGNWSFGTEASLSDGTFVLYGVLIGASDLTLNNAFNLSIAPNASWYQDANLYMQSGASKFAYIYDSSNMSLSVLNTSSITIRGAAGITFLGGKTFEHQRCALFATKLSLYGAASYLTASGFGYPSRGAGASAIAANGEVVSHYQASGNVSYADGGFHAGRGGGYYYSYDSLGCATHPIAYGSAGGSTYQAQGGHGGGSIHIVVQDLFFLDGVVEANGLSCTESDVRLQSQAGGGAGGSIWIDVSHGDISGNGTISARGGNGCITGGGAGSGGRVAVYTADGSLSNFHGFIFVGGGSQSVTATLSNTVYLPAGGTVFVSDGDLTNSKLASSNDGNVGAAVTVASPSSLSSSAQIACPYPTGTSMFHIGQILLGDVDLQLSSCIFEIDKTIASFASDSTFSSILASKPAFARAILQNNATLLCTTSFSISDATVQVLDSTIVFDKNVTLSDDAHLQVSTFGSKLVGLQSEEISAIKEATQPSNNITLLLSAYDALQDTGLTYISGYSISLLNGSKLSFQDSTGRGWESSNVLQGNSLFVSHNASILAKGVVTNHDITWNAHSSFSYFGFSSEGSSKSASGGGHAGPGLAGTQSSNSASTDISTGSGSSSRGNLIFPYGPGGAGGNDLTKRAFGGGGGGGLRFVFSESMELNGLIDVSGESAPLNTVAGGGAGGSIYVDSPRSILRGSGRLYANGGDGGVSSTTTQHGGAGSGGVVSVRVCVDLFEGEVQTKGGLTVKMPAWLPAKMTTADYKRALAQKGLVTNTGSYRKIQQVHAAPNGIFSVHANQSVVTGINNDETWLTVDMCAQNGFGWSSPAYELKYLGSHGHVTRSLQTSAGVRSDLLSAMVSTMQLSDSRDISEIVSHTTTLPLPIGDYNITYLRSAVLSMSGSNVKIQGAGDFTAQAIYGDAESLVTLGGRVRYIPDPNMRFANMTWNITDDSCISAGGQTLSIQDGGQLQVFNVDINDPNIAYPVDIAAFLTANCTIAFYDIILQNNARLLGSKLTLSAETVILRENSSITASGFGPYGGAGGTYATSGYGYGSGSVNDVGGDGGGFGGRGAQGLMTLYREITEDANLGNSGSEVWLNESSIGSQLSSRNSSKYGDYLQPVQMGSGGGGDNQHFGRGGRGGGSIVLHVHGDIFMDSGSSITSDGESVYEGGGGGSGGSVWVRHIDGNRVLTAQPTVVFNGDIIGSGRISADGGKTCPQSGCIVSPEYPGGFGAGGRVRIEKVMELYDGSLSARSGASNNSLSQLEMNKMGTVVRIRAISTLILNQTTDGEPVMEVVFTQTPAFVVQTITSRGQGSGDRYAANASDAIIRGYWTIGYQSKYAHDSLLSSQATASDVQQVLESLGHPDLSKVSVVRNPSDSNGWEWRITFHNYADRISTLQVDPMHLYCTTGQPSLTVELFRPYNGSYSTEYVGENDAPARYDGSELASMISFNFPVLSSTYSYAYWRNSRTFRIVPNNNITYAYLKSMEEHLIMESIFLVPTFEGFIYSLSPPYLKEYYDPNWKYPTSVPSGQPSMQPSGQPSMQPTMQPSSQPSSRPSMQPSSQPTSSPTMQPSSQPTSIPTNQPSSKPTMQPSNQPSASPTMQPTVQPSMQPSSQPSSSPSMQPSSQPSMQPSLQPFSRPTGQPSSQPSMQPSLQPFSRPTGQPSSQPSSSPTGQPSTQPSMQPSAQPNSRPTGQPSSQPSMQPSRQPFSRPTGQPSRQPTMQPSRQPSSQPTMQPSLQPFSRPTGQPSSQPSMQPSLQPFSRPTGQPSSQPSSSPTSQPSTQPSMQPSAQPNSRPTGQPSSQPSSRPTCQPSVQPSGSPSCQPSSQPTNPTGQPSSRPTNPTSQPTRQPSRQPSSQPSIQPTSQPSSQPTFQPSSDPSGQPSSQPTNEPSAQPSAYPSNQPYLKPTSIPTCQPSSLPTKQPSSQPSGAPSLQPVLNPTTQPTSQPTRKPSLQPFSKPSSQPSSQPTSRPSRQPSTQPSLNPTSQPTVQPSLQPIRKPTSIPSSRPSRQPSTQPTSQPSSQPSTSYPTSQPISGPSTQPTAQPSSSPSAQPFLHPTSEPSSQPTTVPSQQPAGDPTAQPSCQPTSRPSKPTLTPTYSPTYVPTISPTFSPTATPTSAAPSFQPTRVPTFEPTLAPSRSPTISPTFAPTATPTLTMEPTAQCSIDSDCGVGKCCCGGNGGDYYGCVEKTANLTCSATCGNHICGVVGLKQSSSFRHCQCVKNCNSAGTTYGNCNAVNGGGGICAGSAVCCCAAVTASTLSTTTFNDICPSCTNDGVPNGWVTQAECNALVLS